MNCAHLDQERHIVDGIGISANFSSYQVTREENSNKFSVKSR